MRPGRFQDHEQRSTQGGRGQHVSDSPRLARSGRPPADHYSIPAARRTTGPSPSSRTSKIQAHRPPTRSRARAHGPGELDQAVGAGRWQFYGDQQAEPVHEAVWGARHRSCRALAIMGGSPLSWRPLPRRSPARMRRRSGSGTRTMRSRCRLASPRGSADRSPAGSGCRSRSFRTPKSSTRSPGSRCLSRRTNAPSGAWRSSDRCRRGGRWKVRALENRW